MMNEIKSWKSTNSFMGSLLANCLLCFNLQEECQVLELYMVHKKRERLSIKLNCSHALCISKLSL